ncbi:MAG TPA: VOC family protein [Lichenihabitans sp.]|jgi:hypothetical protein|nr:VOC family protein [Lichenihabitans sp.]
MSVDLDHILWAAPDLDSGTALLARLTGVAPARGGSHTGLGTRNSLVGLAGAQYLEVIAPDPEQTTIGDRAATIAALPQPGLMTFAVRTSNLDAYRAAAETTGVDIHGPVGMSRARPDGVRLDWACLYVDHPVYGDLIPFAIDWQGSPHPSEVVPQGLGLARFEVLHPEPEPLRRIYEALGIGIEVMRAARPGLRAVLATPRGDVTLLGP